MVLVVDGWDEEIVIYLKVDAGRLVREVHRLDKLGETRRRNETSRRRENL